MYRFLYAIYFIRFKNTKLDHIYNRIIIRVLNFLLPVMFRLSLVRPRLNERDGNRKPDLIVSLTSFPVRIEKIWMVIETLLRQKTKPDKILLWLAKSEFSSRGSLPGRLLYLEKRGLEILFCDENLMPHKKYYYTMTGYPGAHVITVDDDIFYPVNFITNLLEYHNIYPAGIITVLGRRIKVSDNTIFPYKEWEYICSIAKPTYQILPIGAGGVFYPAGSLHPGCFDIEKIKALALNNADLWLKIMSIRAGTKVVCTGGFSRLFIPVHFKENSTLMETNIGQGRNDRVCRDLIDYYNIPISSFIE